MSTYIYFAIAAAVAAAVAAFWIMLRQAKKAAYDQGVADQKAANMIEIKRLNDEAKKIREQIDAGKVKVSPGDL